MPPQSGVSLSLQAKGLEEVECKLARLVAALPKPRKLMNTIGAVLESSTRQRFRTGQSPDGIAWKPSKRAIAAKGKTLVWRGHLRDSITHDADDTRAEVGTNLVYARIHQLGGWIRIKNAGAGLRKGAGPVRTQWKMPARPYLGVSEGDRIEIADQVEKYIHRVLS